MKILRAIRALLRRLFICPACNRVAGSNARCDRCYGGWSDCDL